jgi:hypothetical protein
MAESVAEENEPSQPRRSQRTNVSLSQDSGRVVLPTDSVEEINRLRSGSRWRQRDLKLLKVKFDPAEDCDLPMLDIENEWSLSQYQSAFPFLFPARATVAGLIGQYADHLY